MPLLPAAQRPGLWGRTQRPGLPVSGLRPGGGVRPGSGRTGPGRGMAAHEAAPGPGNQQPRWHRRTRARRLGEARRTPVLLVRDLLTLWREPALLDRVRVAGGSIRVIAPRTGEARPPALGPGVGWLPLQERFALYGNGVTLIDPGVSPEASADPRAPVHGPFSADFRWVTVEGWTEGPFIAPRVRAPSSKPCGRSRGNRSTRSGSCSAPALSSDKLVDVLKSKARGKDIGACRFAEAPTPTTAFARGQQRPHIRAASRECESTM